MASITTISKTITPAVVQKIMAPLPASLPPPPPGQGYEVVATPEGGAEYTGRLISTDRTTPGPFEGPAAQMFFQSLGVVGGVAAGELLAGAPAFVQQIAPKVLSTVQGGLPPWLASSTPSGTQVQAFLIQRVQALKASLVAAVQRRLIPPGLADSIYRSSVANLVAQARRLFPQFINR